jgi:hypothetical protein
MPGNEKEVIEFIVNNRSQLNFPIIGAINKIEIPRENRLEEITNIKQLHNFYSDDAHKKADVFINDKGISIKQSGGAPLYNKAQRKFLIKFFNYFFDVKISNKLIKKLDNKVKEFHQNIINRDINFLDIMDENQFKKILKYLMLEGSAQLIKSKFTAELILIASDKPRLKEDIKIYNFIDYYNEYKSNLVLAIRRIWIGQRSDSEHGRAKSIFSKEENKPWCFDDVSGKPRTHRLYGTKWRDDVLPKNRKTIYYVNVNQKY